MTVVTLFDAEGRDREIGLDQVRVDELGKNSLLWVDIEARDEGELCRVFETLGIDKDSLPRVLDVHGRPQVDNFGPYYQLRLYVPQAKEGAALAPNGRAAMRLDMLVGDNWLVTVHDGDVGYLREYREQNRAETMIGAMIAPALAASLLEVHLEVYFDIIAHIESSIDRIDLRVLSRAADPKLLERMVELRRDVSRLRSLLTAQRVVFYGLGRPDFTLIAESDAASHYKTLAHRFDRAIDEVERTRDLVGGSFDLFTTKTAQDTNELVKLLTFLTAAMGFCAVVAGVFGMNFTTGFFESGDSGFFATIVAMVAIFAASLTFSKWKGWF